MATASIAHLRLADDLEITMVGERWKVTKGTPTWPYLDMQSFQKFLDTSGPVETLAEYQQQFADEKPE